MLRLLKIKFKIEFKVINKGTFIQDLRCQIQEANQMIIKK